MLYRELEGIRDRLDDLLLDDEESNDAEEEQSDHIDEDGEDLDDHPED